MKKHLNTIYHKGMEALIYTVIPISLIVGFINGFWSGLGTLLVLSLTSMFYQLSIAPTVDEYGRIIPEEKGASGAWYK